jgi:hypothetical protein
MFCRHCHARARGPVPTVFSPRAAEAVACRDGTPFKRLRRLAPSLLESRAAVASSGNGAGHCFNVGLVMVAYDCVKGQAGATYSQFQGYTTW